MREGNHSGCPYKSNSFFAFFAVNIPNPIHQRLEEPHHPIAKPVVHAIGGAAFDREIDRRNEKNQIVAQAHLMGMKGLPIKGPKIALGLVIFDRRFDDGNHRRQYFQPMPVQREGRYQKYDDHQRADRGLDSRRQAKAADNHQKSCQEAEKIRAFGE